MRCVTAQEGVNSATDEATRATAQAEFRYLKNNEAKLKDFCRQTGQDRDRFRKQVLGFNGSTAQKAVHAAKRRQTANQTAGNVPSGHAVEVTPPTQKDNSSTGKTYQTEKPSGKALTSSGDGGIIKKKKKSKYKSKYSASEQAERAKKAKEVIERVLSALHFDENGKILDEVVYTASGEEVKIVEKTTLQDKPNSITQIVNAKGGVNRNYYDENGNQFLQISNNGHGHPVEEDLGEFGEHAHNYYFDENNKLKRTDARELTEEERKRNDDML